MKTTTSSAIVVLSALSAAPAWAQPMDAVLSPTIQAMSVAYRNGNAAAENKVVTSIPEAQIPALEDGLSKTLKLRVFRPDNLTMSSSESDVAAKGDQVSFTVNAQTHEVNHMLTLAGTAYQAPLSGAVTKCLQILSLAANRKLDAQLAYSARLGKGGSFTSAVSYNLRGFGNVSMSASVRYTLKF